MISSTPNQQPFIPHPLQPGIGEATAAGTVYRSSYAESTRAVWDPTDLGRPAAKGTVYISVNHSMGATEVSAPDISQTREMSPVTAAVEATDALGSADTLHAQLVAEEAERTELEISTDVEAWRRAVREFGGTEQPNPNAWDRVKKQSVELAYGKAVRILTANESSWVGTLPGVYKKDADACDIVMTQVAHDMRDVSNPNNVNPGSDVVISFSSDQELGQLIEGARQDPAVLKKVTQTISLITASARYKFAKWNNSGQLKAALNLTESFAKSVPGFDLESAGAFSLREDLILCASAIRSGDITKPESAHALHTATAALDTLNVAIAHVRARNLSQPESSAGRQIT